MVNYHLSFSDIPETVWAVFDLYGRCDEIVINTDESGESFVKETGDKVILAPDWLIHSITILISDWLIRRVRRIRT